MKTIAVAFVAVLLVVSELPRGLTFSPTSPAFLWSNIQDEATNNKVKEAVSYQTLSPKDLAKSVMSQGKWSNLLCSSQKPKQSSVDLAIVFVGKEPLDISGRKQEDESLLNSLKASFMRSTFSVAYPYISASEENESVQDKLVSEFAETCGNDAGFDVERLTDINAVNEYVASSMEKKPEGLTPLVVFTNGGTDSQNPHSEGQVLSELISSVEEKGAKYSVLYVSDPLNILSYPSFRQLDRFLAESSGNSSKEDSSACDGICQIKSSLLEGLFVGLVLLIILISGLCCMAGIDTPTRFEAPQDS